MPAARRERKAPNPKPSIAKSEMHHYFGVSDFEICLELGVWNLKLIIGLRA
jgi:hypothetical protein